MPIKAEKILDHQVSTSTQSIYYASTGTYKMTHHFKIAKNL